MRWLESAGRVCGRWGGGDGKGLEGGQDIFRKGMAKFTSGTSPRGSGTYHWATPQIYAVTDNNEHL